tara:strand:+ start:427 stop:1134 length:708 start_codon:yes stop_codon:yes gene_type:complete
MTVKTPLYPKYKLYFNEEDKTYNLEFDAESLTTTYRLVLSDIGSEAIKTALCNLPIYKTFGAFWGYKDQLANKELWNCEAPEEGSVLVQLSSKDEEALIAVANHLSDASCWRIKYSEPLRPGDIVPIPTPAKWGDWHFNKSNLCLNLLPYPSCTHKYPFYQIDLERVNSNSEILDWIFQINHKNLNLYGKNVVRDLINAFDDILDPQNNCCSSGKNKVFSGSELAKKYAEALKND